MKSKERVSRITRRKIIGEKEKKRLKKESAEKERIDRKLEENESEKTERLTVRRKAEIEWGNNVN